LISKISINRKENKLTVSRTKPKYLTTIPLIILPALVGYEMVDIQQGASAELAFISLKYPTSLRELIVILKKPPK